MDDSGQIHTIEGIVAGMVILLALIYIMGSITFVSPQTEKTTVMKLSVKAQDILNVLSTPDKPGNFSNPLERCIAAWKGGIANQSQVTNPEEPSIIWLNDKIHSDDNNQSLMPSYLKGNKTNILYNVDLMYIDDTASAAAGREVFVSKPVIFMGDPHDNAVVATKLIVLNYYDVNSSSLSYWNHTALPKTVEVKLALWYI
jgi:hypothetical protein